MSLLNLRRHFEAKIRNSFPHKHLPFNLIDIGTARCGRRLGQYNASHQAGAGDHIMNRFSPLLVICIASQAVALDPNVPGSVFVRVVDVGAGLSIDPL